MLHDGDQNTRAKYDVFFADSISPAVRARRYVDGKKVEPPANMDCTPTRWP